MERNAPPFFKQGPSAQARLAFFAVLALSLLILDARLHMLGPIRQTLGTILYPFQQTMLAPRDMLRGGASYFVDQKALRAENAALKQDQIALGAQAQRAAQLALENTQLRALAGLKETRFPQSVVAEVLYDTRDPFVRRLALSKGSQQGVALGMPVVDDKGVVGQITRVFPFASEMSLITDKEQAIPVQVVRNGLRTVAYGGQQAGVLDVRFMAANADVMVNDLLVTSGIDGVYPAGLAVGKVVQVERAASFGFAKILCVPTGGVQQHRHLLILLTSQEAANPLPKAETPYDAKAARRGKTSRPGAEDPVTPGQSQ